MHTHTRSLPRVGVAFLLSVMVLTSFTFLNASSAEAATKYYSRSSARSYESGNFSAYASRGRDSALQKKINKLSDEKVEKLPVPILLGVPLTSLTKNFGDPRDGGARTHEGLDIMAARGSFIVSPTKAVVIRVGTGDTEGNYVYTANPGGETFAYMHLDSVADGVVAGTELEVGDLIGYVGNTGNAAGGATHLHFEIRDGRTPTDPYLRLTREFTLTERIDGLKSVLAMLLEKQKKLADT